ncbi:hemolysin family protein [Actinomyces provencensis]|uniref:hemolysin family protein n=1 Tax=Actinomyces provencensis TaxID=1720198 RepID=UPI00096A6BDB|nr:hemolysin family protein [Actinomyces provencensis]
MTEVLLLLLSMVVVAAGGAFVAAEFSLITVNRASVESAADDGDRRARGVLEALRHLSTQLSGAQVGITVTNLALGFLAEPSLARLIRPALADLGVPDAGITTVSVTIALLTATVITMVFGELVPKNLAISRPLATARAVQGFQRGFTRAVAWPIRLSNGTANALLRIVGITPQEELASARSAEELTSLVRHSALRGTLAADTADLVGRTLTFGDRRARDVMVPASSMVTLSPTSTVSDMVRRSRRTGHSRFPVVSVSEEGGILRQMPVGIAHIRSSLSLPVELWGDTTVDALSAPATLVPDSVHIDDLLERLRHGGLQMALLIDEFGALAGLVTLEDVVEELVGELYDEHDPAERPPGPPPPPGGTVLPGLTRLDELPDLIGVTLPDSPDAGTLGGLVSARLGRLAEEGDEVVLVTSPPGAHDLHVEVLSVSGHRVTSVLVEDLPGDGTDGDGGARADGSAGSGP